MLGSNGIAEGDPLDSPDFDAVAFMNKMFPTEASLAGLDPLIITLRAKIRRTDAEILTAVRQQSDRGSCSREEVAEAREGIGQLFGRIAAIRHQAEASEAMVQDICRDIRRLDNAKSHLTSTITAFRRLSMLVTAVDQLQRAVERNEYAESAQLIEAVQQLAAHFQSFVAIPKVAELSTRVTALQRTVQVNAMQEFELLGSNDDNPSTLLLDRLRACTAVIDALGYKARDELTSAVCRKEMAVYTAIFGTTGETAALERTDRRYLWLRKRLASRAQVWSVFPEAWHVQHLVCLSFCAMTKAHLAEILDLKSGELPGQVEALLRAVNATNDFENELAARFTPATLAPEGAVDEDGNPTADHAADDGMSASGIRDRYERLFKERQAAAAVAAEGGDQGTISNTVIQASPILAQFQGSISTVFSRHLTVYVDAQERELQATLEGLIAEETWTPAPDASGGNSGGVLRSAIQLFAIIKTSLLRCSKYITRGPALLALMNTFQRVVRSYASHLKVRLPKTATGGTSATPNLGSTDWHVRMGEGDVVAACAIVATAEYCVEVVAGLAANVTKLLEQPLQNQVDTAEEEDAFLAVATAAVSVLVLGLETRLGAHLALLMRTNWATLESVGDQSEWVSAVGRTLAEAAPKLSAGLPDHHWAFLCDKLGSGFSRRLGEAVLRCRKISEAGSQQMLLDVHAARTLLLAFPLSAGKEGPSATMTATVNRDLGRTEAMLKVVGSRADTVVHNFATLMPDASAADFHRIVDLKVLKKAEASALLEAYNRRAERTTGGESLGSVAVRSQPVGSPRTPRPATATAAASAAAAAFRDATPNSAAALRVQASTQELASRFKNNANTAAMRASAVAGSATDRVRESFLGMKMLGFTMGRSGSPGGSLSGGQPSGQSDSGRR